MKSLYNTQITDDGVLKMTLIIVGAQGITYPPGYCSE